MQHAGTQSAENVIKKEFLWPPDTLDDAAEHPEGEHVEKNMLEVGVHKHVCEQLEDVEVGGHEEMKPQNVVQIHPQRSLPGQHGHESQQIDNQKILGDGGDVAYHLCLYNIIVV